MDINQYFPDQLRQRFNKDMAIRKLAAGTQIAYYRGVISPLGTLSIKR